MKIIKRKIFLLLFGKESLKGYYKPSEEKKKGYVYASIFPDNDAVNLFLKQEQENQ